MPWSCTRFHQLVHMEKNWITLIIQFHQFLPMCSRQEPPPSSKLHPIYGHPWGFLIVFRFLHSGLSCEDLLENIFRLGPPSCTCGTYERQTTLVVVPGHHLLKAPRLESCRTSCSHGFCHPDRGGMPTGPSLHLIPYCVPGTNSRGEHASLSHTVSWESRISLEKIQTQIQGPEGRTWQWLQGLFSDAEHPLASAPRKYQPGRCTQVPAPLI